MTWLALVFALELGVIPDGAFLMYDRQPTPVEAGGGYYLTSIDVLDFGRSFYTDLQVELIILDYLRIGGGLRTTMLSTEDYTFSPEATNYNFLFGVILGPVQITWNHYCMHPTMAYMYDYVPVSGWEGSYDEVGLKVSGCVPLWKGK